MEATDLDSYLYYRDFQNYRAGTYCDTIGKYDRQNTVTVQPRRLVTIDFILCDH
jgi:hypothetical protein